MHEWTRLILRGDGIANVALALVLAVFAERVAAAAGLAIVWPVYTAGVLLAFYGLEQWVSAQRILRSTLVVFATADFAFAVAAGLFFLLDPTGADRWARLASGSLAVVVSVVGVTKVILSRSWGLRDAPAPSDASTVV